MVCVLVIWLHLRVGISQSASNSIHHFHYESTHWSSSFFTWHHHQATKIQTSSWYLLSIWTKFSWARHHQDCVLPILFFSLLSPDSFEVSVGGVSKIPCLQFRPLEISEYIQRTKTGPQMALLYTVFRFLASFLFISPDYWGCTWWKLSAVQKFYSCTWQRYAWCPWQPCLVRFDWPFFEVLVMPHIFLPDSGHSGRFQCHSSGIYQPKFHSCHGILIFW